jgi:hypothetical protein
MRLATYLPDEEPAGEEPAPTWRIDLIITVSVLVFVLSSMLAMG